MAIKMDPNGIWYHGSDKVFTVLKKGSTVTQWRALAEAFSHQPTILEYDDAGVIHHNGVKNGYLYCIAEAVSIEKDLCRHPTTTMEENAEFITQRPLTVRCLTEERIQP